MASRYDAASSRARFFLENFDEIDLAEMAASGEAAARKARATNDRVRKIAEELIAGDASLDGNEPEAGRRIIAALDAEETTP